MAVPGVFGGLVEPQAMFQVLQHPKVVQRVQVAGNGQRDRPDPRPPGRVGRRRAVRGGFLQGIQYGQRLTDRHVAIDQCGHRPAGFTAL